MTSNIIGREFRIVVTRLDIWGIFFIVRKGRRSLITLIAEIPPPSIKLPAQPNVTTIKSSYIQ